jgi:hypothetical protein
MHITSFTPSQSILSTKKSPQFGMLPSESRPTTPDLFMQLRVQPKPGTRGEALITRKFEQYGLKSATYIGHTPDGRPVYQDKRLATSSEITAAQKKEQDKLFKILEKSLGCQNSQYYNGCIQLVFRTNTSANTLKVALYYLNLAKEKWDSIRKNQDPKKNKALKRWEDQTDQHKVRVFVGMLILASKNLQDSVYSSRAWSKFTNFSIPDINTIEWAMFETLDFRLKVDKDKFDEWWKKANPQKAESNENLFQVAELSK